MFLPRIFIPVKLTVGQQIKLDTASSKHVVQVLRLIANDSLIIFNNFGGEFLARLLDNDKYQASVYLEEFKPTSRESPLHINLGQGVSRGEKMDFTLQKSVEMGVHSVAPLFTKYCNVKLTQERLARRQLHWQRVAISAAEQSGRSIVPEVFDAQSLAEWMPKTKGLRLLLDPNANAVLNDFTKKLNEVTVLIGPEGGLSEEEISAAKQHGFVPIKLGPRILRTETAGLAIISALQTKWGDF